MLRDSFGRTIGKLRISVTDRCDLRCVYCMPAEGLAWKPRGDLLSYEEITRLARVFCDLGVTELRLTGGEPLVRADVPALVRMLRQSSGAKDIAISTNGIQLARYARPLADAGLDRVNVSLDALDPARFHELTRRDGLDAVLAGIAAACEVFPGRVKLNAVAMRGYTEHEVWAFCEMARRCDLVVRFIEYMPLDADHKWRREDVLGGSELRAQIQERYTIVPVEEPDRHAPSRDWRFADAPGGVGFIDSVTAPFCQACDRVRITADGKLRTCLFSQVETDLRTPMRAGATDAELAALIEGAVWLKEAGHNIGTVDFVPASRSMSQIGG